MTRAELAKLIEIRDGLKNAYWDCTKWRWAAKFDQFIRDVEHVLGQGAPSRKGIFRDHNCAYCNDGALPCRQGHPRRCEYPHARND